MKKIPDFQTEEEEIEFWETHDSTEYIGEGDEIHIVFGEALKKRVADRKKKKEEKKIVTGMGKCPYCGSGNTIMNLLLHIRECRDCTGTWDITG
jgi:hypothetical protein